MDLKEKKLKKKLQIQKVPKSHKLVIAMLTLFLQEKACAALGLTVFPWNVPSLS